MSPAPTHDPNTPPPLRWSRAFAFATLSGGLGMVGHSLVTGHAVDVSLLLAVIFALALVARLAASTQRSAWVLGGAAVALQLATHGVMMVMTGGHHAGGAASAAGVHSMGSMHAMHGGSHAMAAAVPQAAASGVSHVLALMVAFHLLAAIVGVFVLVRLERRAWSVVRTVVTRLVARFRSLDGEAFGGSGAATGTPRRRPRDGAWTAASWLVRAGARRGPPARALA